jgi:PEGA domain
MREPVILISLFLVLAIIALPIAGAAETPASNNSLAQPRIKSPETSPVIRITQSQTSQRPSGEVEVPITPRSTPGPTTIPHTTASHTQTIPQTTIPHTTVSPTQTIPQTTVPHTTVSHTQTIPQTTVPHTTVSPTQTVLSTTGPTTQTTPVPVVTVTVLVYGSRDVYRPSYYYPPGYSYSGYYPPGYPYDSNSYYATGSLVVRSSPSDAVVIIDGYDSETTPFVFGGLTTGYHTVEVNYPGYEAYVTNVYIESGTSMEVDANLVPLVNYGSIFVDSTPRGADVYLDGNYQGVSPVTISSVNEGYHQLELHLAGYEVLTTSENVNGGQGTTVNLVMVPYSSSSDTGSIDITSNLPGALIYLDGIYKGSAQSGTLNVIAVSPGSHTVLLHLPGYADVTRTVQVTSGQVMDVNAVFTPEVQQATASPGTGSIVVTSSPSGGQVVVDNLFRGVAPVTIYNVATGTHVINLKLAGYSDWSTSVDVPAGQVVQVPATFTPAGTVPAPTRTALPAMVSIGALALGVLAMRERVRR